jgi:hypothetical protein
MYYNLDHTLPALPDDLALVDPWLPHPLRIYKPTTRGRLRNAAEIPESGQDSTRMPRRLKISKKFGLQATTPVCEVHLQRGNLC